ncbi:hypothetical protein [Catenuloplanes japonicus]|uniref:hypothetical protein n=1 Tax=Catenuloplanes japonicus TaxID=33876 RepID=UPI000525661C|nr:hypothetical protein [Catenuloplanes japonicus]
MTDLQIRTTVTPAVTAPRHYLVPFTENPPGPPPPLPPVPKSTGIGVTVTGASASALLIGAAAVASQALDGTAWALPLGAAVVTAGATRFVAHHRRQQP